MSKENLKEFLLKVQENEDLQAKIKEISDENVKEGRQAFIDIAQEAGYRLELEDFDIEKKISDDELDKVAGGMPGPPSHDESHEDLEDIIWKAIKGFFGW